MLADNDLSGNGYQIDESGFTIPDKLMRPTIRNERKEFGVFTFIVRSCSVEEMLRRVYGRVGLCLKVFRQQTDKPLDAFCWSEKTGVKLTDCTKAQNLFARHGFAPRVYDVVRVNRHWAQVTDYVTDDGGTFDRTAAREIVKRYGVRCRGNDMNEANWIGSQMVDFQAHFLPENYRDGLIERIEQHTAWGSSVKPYQDFLGRHSQRDTSHRKTMMRWDEMDWRGKTVLDLGCNAGMFCIEAALDGAKRIVGVDLPHVADVAFEVANWFHRWNNDYLGLRLPTEKDEIVKRTGIKQFDVVLCISCKQVKPIPWAFDLCREVCYFEGHVPDRESTHRPALEQHFARVEFLGMTRDHGPRPLFRCWK